MAAKDGDGLLARQPGMTHCGAKSIARCLPSNARTRSHFAAVRLARFYVNARNVWIPKVGRRVAKRSLAQANAEVHRARDYPLAVGRNSQGNRRPLCGRP